MAKSKVTSEDFGALFAEADEELAFERETQESRNSGVTQASLRRDPGVTEESSRRHSGVTDESPMSHLGVTQASLDPPEFVDISDHSKSRRHSGVTDASPEVSSRRHSGVTEKKIQASRIEILGKVEKALVIFVCEECRKIASLETNFIPNEELETLLTLNPHGLRSLIYRVRKKGFFEVTSKQLQHTGLRKFTVPQHIYDQFSAHVSLRRHSGVIQAYPQASPEASLLPSSSSSLKEQSSKNTTTTEDLPDVWKQINVTPLQDLGQPFGETHIKQLYKSGKMNPAQVQESIHRVAYAVKHRTQPFKRGPIAMLMGILKDGREFDPPVGYTGPATPAQEEASTPESRREAEEAMRNFYKNNQIPRGQA